MNETDMHELMDLATDGVERPSLAAAALRTAHRRRTRRRGVIAAAASSAVVVAVVVATNLGGTTSVAPPTSPSQTPSVSSSTPTDSTGRTRWDPTTVDDLPPADPTIAPALPELVDPPESSPLVTDEPIDAAVVAVEDKGAIQILSTDGSWRSVATTEQSPRAHLSPEGTRLVVDYYADTEVGATVYDLASGSTQQVPFPAGYRGWDFQSWSFVDEATLLFDDLDGGFLIDLVSGDVERVPFPTQFSWTVDPAGVVVESADVDGPSSVTEWSGGEARTVRTSETLERIHANADSVAATSYDRRQFSLVVADRQTLTPQSVLRLGDGRGNTSGAFSNGGLGVLALAADGTVLMRVAVPDEGPDGFRVAAWEPGAGELSLVSSATSVLLGDLRGGTAACLRLARRGAAVVVRGRSMGSENRRRPAAHRSGDRAGAARRDRPAGVLPAALRPADRGGGAGGRGGGRGAGGGRRRVLAHGATGLEISTSAAQPPRHPAGGVVVVLYGSNSGATVVDLATGASRRLDLPAGFVEVDNTTWRFVDEDTLFVQGGNSFEVDATTGRPPRSTTTPTRSTTPALRWRPTAASARECSPTGPTAHHGRSA